MMLAAVVFTQWMLVFRPVSRAERAALRDWAESHGCTLVRCSGSSLYDRQARERGVRDGYLYLVRVRAAGGAERYAWVRLRWSPFPDERLEVVRFRWEYPAPSPLG
jgi:hypothetical protein